MAEEITKLKTKRSVIRSSVTKYCKRIENSLKESDVDINDLEENLEQLIKKADELKIADKEFEGYLTGEECLKEFESIEEYNEKITKWSHRATKKINESRSHTNLPMSAHVLNTQSVQNTQEKINVKLPKLSIPKFFGDTSHWLTFWSCFENAIHNNASLNKIDKMNYLKAHLGSIAASTIEGFAISEENYDNVIKLLKERFGRKDLLINTHLNNLLNIPPLRNSSDLNNFRIIVDKCKTQIRSLETLDVATDSYGSILHQIILKLLPHDLILEYSKIEDTSSNINTLMEFLSKELAAREKAKFMSQRKVEDKQSFPQNLSIKDKGKQYRFKTATAADLFSGTDLKEHKIICAFCSAFNHRTNDCEYAKRLSPDEKKSLLRKKGYCFKCITRFHIARDCKRKIICNNCGRNHSTIMCEDFKEKFNRSPKTNLTVENSNAGVKDLENPEIKFDLSNNSTLDEVFLQTLVVRIKGKDREYSLRTIIDTGSQNSYISKYAAKVLKLSSLRELTINHSLFGGLQIPEVHNCYKLKLSNVDKSYTCDVEVLDQGKICATIPKIENPEWIQKLKNMGIYASDIFEREASLVFERNPQEIHLLLGADVAGTIFTDMIKPLPWKGVVALKTKLGWTVMGKATSSPNCPRNSISALSLSLLISNSKISDLWRLDILGITDDKESKNKIELEEETMKYFTDTVKQNEDGRYEVSLPWVLDRNALPSNLNLAKNSLHRTELNLRNIGKREDYGRVFEEWEANGIIEPANSSDSMQEKGTHYLPHRPVIKETSVTTKIRPVYNASARTRSFPSLNDCLTKGPNLIEIIPSILNRFRKYPVGISSDIEKAFLQISIKPEDRDFLRFLWFDEDNNIKVYRHRRVVFGLTSSPFLLAATLNHLLDKTSEADLKETVQILRNSFYVDNCLTSLNSLEEMNKFIEESQKILLTAHFNLRCWQSNYPSPIINEPAPETTLVLGMIWKLKEDSLGCKIEESIDITSPLTKRKLLSVTQKVFDPVGYTAPVTLIPKMILQKTWNSKLKWDDELPPALAKPFELWLKHLPTLSQTRIPRWLNFTSENENSATLHVFCDASKQAYATCAYVRTENVPAVKVQLVSARSRVAPLKPLTIPRLELLSCLIGARLASKICSDLKIEKSKTFLWSDSSTALTWIRSEEQWGTFVHNRVKEIKALTESCTWRFVPGKMNPADLPSRGCTAEHLIKSQWWEGPEWLKKCPEDWPQIEVTPDAKIINSEKRKTIVSAINVKHEPVEYFNRISSYKKLIKVTAWIFRFLKNSKLKTEDRKLTNLDLDDLKQAEKFVLRKIQDEELTENIKNIQTYRGSDGLLRVKSRISNRKDLENFRYPILLPNKNEIVKRLIMERHIDLQHAGLQMLISNLREDYWIIKCRRTIRQVIKTCIICKRFSSVPLQTIPIPLPEDRVKDAAVFEVTGIDLTGPLFLKEGRKCWIVLFTCAIYRAVHLELVTSLTTDCFILALRRFIARRGRPKKIYSDNGRNLVGTSTVLNTLDWKKINDFATAKKIEWKFNPPSAPWWGGFWERLIGVLKNILRRVLGKASLNEEELTTILCDAESLINTRPLTYLSEDPDDLTALTPAMFLQEIIESGVPDLDLIDSQNLRKRFLYRVKLRQDLKNRFRNEYLGLLKSYSNSLKDSSITEGDLVLIGDNNVKRINWPLAKVVRTIPGKDGKVRVVEVKTQSGIFLRPIQRIYPLEIQSISRPQDGNDQGPTIPNIRHSRYGRLLKTPQRV